MVFDFEGHAKQEDVDQWLETILNVLPFGARGRLTKEPQFVSVPELGPEHEGYHIVIERAPKEAIISGKLTNVYNGGPGVDKIAIINGKAFNLKPYEIAQLTYDWS